MSDQSMIDAATRRLALALDALDASLDRRLEAERRGAALSNQFQALGTDRSRPRPSSCRNRPFAPAESANAISHAGSIGNRKCPRGNRRATQAVKEM